MKLNEQAHDELVKNLATRLSKTSGLRTRIYRTHISSVIVCGHYAYKLKRPVRLPFVDFSSAALRREDCKRELRMNQRTAPGLYLGIVKITGKTEHPVLKGSGPTIDWAVKMRRFKQSALLSRLIARGELSEKHARCLGQHLAEYSIRLPGLAPEVTAKHRTTMTWLLQSLDEILNVFPKQGPLAQNIRAWAKSEETALHGLLERRRKSGFYRDCHADLHLGNLVKLGKQIIAFDALEFNEELSQIDVVNDIAFAFMDFLAYGRPDLAWSMINQWLENSADYEGLNLLRYYTLYRAVVRAKVAALTTCGHATSESFERYWNLAGSLISPANPPRLILVAGLSGSGKSTVARQLSAALSGVQLRSDVVRKHLFADLQSNPKALYARAATQKTYSQLSQLASRLLEQNMTVIVDATFLSQPEVDTFTRLAFTHQIALQVVWCEAPLNVLEKRIRKRLASGKDPSDATVAVLHRQISRSAQHPVCWPVKPMRLDTNAKRSRVTTRIWGLARELLMTK